VLAEVNENDLRNLRTFAYHLGLVYQIHDDILDVTAEPGWTGKDSGIDKANKHQSISHLLGVEGARELEARHTREAESALENLTIEIPFLRNVLEVIRSR
jgi:geranylgeranyl pyrophosphate synthase